MEASPRSDVPISRAECSSDQLHINAHDFGIRYLTSKCPHTFVYVVYLVTEKHVYIGWPTLPIVRWGVTTIGLSDVRVAS